MHKCTMKRSRERDNPDDDDVKPPIGPKRSSFKITPEAPSSNPTNNNPNNNNNNHNNNNNVDAIAGTSIGNNKEQDRFLPIANVGRIMKKVIPPNGKISKDAKETVQECVSEFISFVTGEASDKCQREKRKTINGDDILWAIMTLGFEDYVTPLKLYLTKYREIEGEKVNIPKQHQQQQQQQQQRIEQHMQHDHNVNIPFSSIYPPGNLISQPSFVPTDPPFPLPFSQNPLQTTTMPQHAATLPQQDHVEDHW